MRYECEREDWYMTISWRKRRVVDAAAKWLRAVRWEWFITLTFPWDVAFSTADHKLRELFNALERFHRTTIGYVAGKESRSRHDGGRVPWHFHLLVTSRVPISSEAIQSFWLGLIRRGLQTEAEILRRGEHAQVEPYESHRRGPEYCLKTMNEGTSDWYIHRLREFLPGIPGAKRPNHRTVRRQRRGGEQASR
ncbi:MAG TPA: hypothetical protein VIJ79_13390 [Acidobacteriaceae bacterium]